MTSLFIVNPEVEKFVLKNEKVFKTDTDAALGVSFEERTLFPYA